MLVSTEAVRINGAWRNVQVWVNPLALACNLGPKAARSKSQGANVRFGSVRVKVLPQ